MRFSKLRLPNNSLAIISHTTPISTDSSTTHMTEASRRVRLRNENNKHTLIWQSSSNNNQKIQSSVGYRLANRWFVVVMIFCVWRRARIVCFVSFEPTHSHKRAPPRFTTFVDQTRISEYFRHTKDTLEWSLWLGWWYVERSVAEWKNGCGRNFREFKRESVITNNRSAEKHNTLNELETIIVRCRWRVTLWTRTRNVTTQQLEKTKNHWTDSNKLISNKHSSRMWPFVESIKFDNIFNENDISGNLSQLIENTSSSRSNCLIQFIIRIRFMVQWSIRKHSYATHTSRRNECANV